MDDTFVEKMQNLNEAEQLLAACNIRGTIRNHESHMRINRLIMDEARSLLIREGSRLPGGTTQE